MLKSMENIKLTEEQMQVFLAVINEIEIYRNLSEEEKRILIRSIMERPYMDLRSDWAFKHLLQNKAILKMLIEDILDIKLSSVEHLPNEIDKTRKNDKNIIMDVLCKSADGKEEFILEMQRKKLSSFKNRMIFYGASMIHAQLKPRDSYINLKPVYVVCFMDFELEHKTDQLLYRYQMRENTSGELYGNQLTICLCELPRLKKTSIEGLNPLESWFYLLENMRTFAGRPEDLGKRYAPIAEAAMMHDLPGKEQVQYFRGMISDEEKQELYTDGFAEGVKQGIEKGIEKNRIQTARAMLQDGMSVEAVSKYTGLTETEIQKLVNS